MKAIRWYHIILILAFVSCDNEYDRIFTNSDTQFVRFFVLVDNDNNVLEYPQVNGGLIPVETLEYSKFLPLKIPVALSAADVEEDISINFSTEISNNIQGISLQPENQLIFNSEKLVDTIYINFNQSWNETNGAFLKLKLTDISNPNITLGMPNAIQPLNEITVNFEEVDFIYGFEDNNIAIEGIENESFDFRVLFPNGFEESEVNFETLLNTPQESFNYTTTLISVEPNAATYRFTLTDDLTAFENLSFSESITLAEINNYTLNGSVLEISKGRASNSTASLNFFNLEDPFYRLFGERWYFDENDNQCEWQAWNAFAVPVEVAVGGIFDRNNDGYHDEQIGFVSPNAPLGTNPFDIRRIINGESISSPGLNLEQALDFIPQELQDGTFSQVNGTVKVIPNNISLIRTSDDAIINIPIVSSSGNYQIIDDTANLWEITLEITYDFSAVGGTAEGNFQYVIYNQNGQPEPTLLDEDCLGSFDL